MASDVEICNRGLQLLGASRITSLSDDSVSARAMNAAYDAVRLAELRGHNWGFAITRDQLAASATTPAFGRANEFPWPSDCLRILPPYPEDNSLSRDWIIEGRSILTDDSAPLNVRYVKDVTDPNTMDPLFREAFSAKLAEATCEEITQSNAKIDTAIKAYKTAIREAKRVNAIEQVPQESAEDTWITGRA